jgi:hypothetical protein
MQEKRLGQWMRGEVRSANWEAEGKNGDECGLERGWRDNAGAGSAPGGGGGGGMAGIDETGCNDDK